VITSFVQVVLLLACTMWSVSLYLPVSTTLITIESMCTLLGAVEILDRVEDGFGVWRFSSVQHASDSELASSTL
jgi:hypothetical protein